MVVAWWVVGCLVVFAMDLLGLWWVFDGFCFVLFFFLNFGFFGSGGFGQ